MVETKKPTEGNHVLCGRLPRRNITQEDVRRGVVCKYEESCTNKCDYKKMIKHEKPSIAKGIKIYSKEHHEDE